MQNETVNSMFGKSGQKFETESLVLADGTRLDIYFFSHATLGFVWNGITVYVDPLMEYADFSKLPPADLILVTHEHYDHLDKSAIKGATREDGATMILGSTVVADEYPIVRGMRPGNTVDTNKGIIVQAVPAYNTSDDKQQFHPKNREDNGYILNFGTYRVYVAGDTEFIPEMRELGRIDIAFLPVNLPYTMTPEMAAEAVRAISPSVFFPYHTTDTDMDRLRIAMSDTPSIDTRIHTMP